MASTRRFLLRAIRLSLRSRRWLGHWAISLTWRWRSDAPLWSAPLVSLPLLRWTRRARRREAGMDIYVIRHGQTDANLRHELQGRRDVPLNEQGREQARRRAGVSRRARDPVRPGLLEPAWSRGRDRADCCAEMRRLRRTTASWRWTTSPTRAWTCGNPPEVVTFFSDFARNPAPAGMEQLSSVTARRGSSRTSRAQVRERVLVSTHAILMKGILEYLTPDSRGSYWSKFIGNCAVYQCVWRDEAFSVPVEVVDAERG